MALARAELRKMLNAWRDGVATNEPDLLKHLAENFDEHEAQLVQMDHQLELAKVMDKAEIAPTRGIVRWDGRFHRITLGRFVIHHPQGGTTFEAGGRIEETVDER